jgi:hypothetical protein
MHGIEQNPKLGYYKVGSEVFYSKPQAYLYASKTRQKPTWHFNELVFARSDWSIEPETDLRELYRLRAVQLREKYDWIRIEASGGGDSTTAIFSFLLNGIHLDEVVFRYPKTAAKDAVYDAFTTNANNTLGEAEFAAKPLFDWIRTNYPKTKTTFHDYSEFMFEQETTRDESWIFTTRDWFQPGHGDKHNNLNSKEHRDLADTGKKICVLYGIDKPRMTIIDSNWYFYFNDVMCNHPSPIVGDYTNITTELFYWTPDLPELVVKQVHMIKNWFELPQNQHLQFMVNWSGNLSKERTAYEHVAKSIIYPDYDLETWQTSKPSNSFFNEMDHWFYKNLEGTNLYSAWESGLQHLANNISPDLLIYELDRPTGLKVNFTPNYYFGTTKYQATPALLNRDYITKSNTDYRIVKDRKLKVVQPSKR